MQRTSTTQDRKTKPRPKGTKPAGRPRRPKAVSTTFGKWVLQQLKRLGWTQTDLARRTPFGRPEVTKWLHDTRPPTLEGVHWLAMALTGEAPEGIDPADLELVEVDPRVSDPPEKGDARIAGDPYDAVAARLIRLCIGTWGAAPRKSSRGTRKRKADY